MKDKRPGSSFIKLIEIMSRLRGPDGCLWDREQTHQSLKRHLVEEAYEVIDAIEGNDVKHLQEELGDLLLQIVFHAQIASEEDYFDIDDLIEKIISKLERRHPHIFGEVEVASSEEIINNWEEIKRNEKKISTLLGEVSSHLPSLMYSYKIQQRAARAGFDWEKIDGVYKKIEEEFEELKNEQKKEKQEDELGDLIFALVNLARFLGIDPEIALRKTTGRFEKRFKDMEKQAGSADNFKKLNLQEKETLWQRAKQRTDIGD